VAAATTSAPPVVARVPATTNEAVVPPMVAEVKTNDAVAIAPVVVPPSTTITNVPALETNPPPSLVATSGVGNVAITVPPTPTAVVVTPETNAASAAAVPPPELVKRVVTREGLLKGTFSIQAPTYFELRSLDNNRLINYVYSPSTNIVLKSFKGRRVQITGEELLDERWPNTPVIVTDEINDAP